MSDTFRVKNDLKHGKDLSPLLVHFALGYGISEVSVNEEGFKFSVTYQLLVYADINFLSISIHTVKNTGDVLVATKESGIEVNDD